MEKVTQKLATTEPLNEEAVPHSPRGLEVEVKMLLIKKTWSEAEIIYRQSSPIGFETHLRGHP